MHRPAPHTGETETLDTTVTRYFIQQTLPGVGITLQLRSGGRFPAWLIATDPSKRAGDALPHIVRGHAERNLEALLALRAGTHDAALPKPTIVELPL